MSRPQIILLTDTVLFGEIGNSRYMGAYALAGQLEKAGFRVLVVDYFTRHPHFFQFLESFLSSDLLFVGISSTFLAPQVSTLTERRNRSAGLDLYYKGELWFEQGEDLKTWLLALKDQIQSHSPNAKIILGGAKSQFAIWRKDFYQPVDYVCLGPADQTLQQVAFALKDKKEISTEDFNGVKLLQNSIDTQNKACPSIQWTERFAVQAGESLPIEIARGCVFNCKFCHYDKKESFRKDLELLKQELISNFERFGTDTYHFCDDCFNDHPQKVESICKLFLSLPFPIEWVAYSRVDVAVKFPETMELMIKSGARGLYFGLESFDYQVALKAGKGTPTEKVKEFLIDFKNRYSEQCLLEGSFIVGLPGETVQSQTATADWIFENPVFDFLTIGPLGIMPYLSSLDKKLFDYAEYSRNPEKFGFEKIDYTKRYWSHQTFDSVLADKMATDIKNQWNQIKGPQAIRTIWLYPHLKTLGFSKEQIFAMARNSDELGPSAIPEIADRFQHHIEKYWDLLKEKNSP